MVLCPIKAQGQVLTRAHKALVVCLLLPTFLTMYLNTSLPSPLCLPSCCSSDGLEVMGHRSRAHQDYEWAGHPIALRKSNLVGGAQFFWGQMENNNRNHLEQTWGLSTSSCLSKAWTAERAILKGDDERANLL